MYELHDVTRCKIFYIHMCVVCYRKFLLLVTEIKDVLYIKFCIVFMCNEGSSSVLSIHPIDTVENHCPFMYNRVTVRLTLLHLGILYRASLISGLHYNYCLILTACMNGMNHLNHTLMIKDTVQHILLGIPSYVYFTKI